MISRTLIENILLIVGESFWFFSAASQLHHVIKKKSTKGLSATTTTLNAAGNVAWVIYFNLRGLWLPLTTNLLMFLISISLLSYILGHNRKQFRRGLLAIAIISPLTAYMLWAHPNASGWIAVTYNFIANTPYLLHVIKTKHLPGVSGRAICFTWGALLAVLSYAVLVNALPLVVGCVQGIIYEAVVTWYFLRYRNQKIT